jgi:drug/metabolite transporter (DMT)-like permease
LYYLVLINIVLLVSGQILWKIGLQSLGGIKLDNLLALVLSPYILAGMVLYVIATGVWFVVLSKAELSAVYPLQSLAYALGIVAGILIFKEHVPAIRWVGVSVIVFGVYLVTLK